MLNEIKDIRASMWISASAGTGKTKSLIDRILALLLNGARPSGILCLTYTKAAATEMSSRLSLYLRKLNQMTDEQLSKELQELGFNDNYKNIARNLYTQTTSTQWVTIQTIHSFCLGLLEKFPLETGLFPNIEICDDYQYEQLITEAINAILTDDTYRTDLENISEYECDLSDFIKSFGMNIKCFIDKHDDFAKLYATYFNVESAHLRMEDIEALLFEKLFNNEHRRIFRELAGELAKGSKSDINKAEILMKNAERPNSSFVYAFLTKELKPLANLCTKQVEHLRPRMEEIAQKAMTFVDDMKRFTAARVNASLFTVIKAIFNKLEELKRLHHCLDYNDIILNAVLLLENIDWVMYKTDGGLNHVLVDEAQDTSPEQWELIKKITGEFFSNYQSGKTLFVVGDEKQSIYSFQGADVRLFSKMHEYFKNAAEQSGQKFYDVELKKSYRSLGNVLSFVDEAFKDTFNTKHETNRELGRGVVDIVEAFQAEDTDDETQELDVAEKNIAAYIAQYIRHAIDTGVEVGKEKRVAKPSDFLILFQRRKTAMIYPIINALKAINIPVAGIDRTRLKEELIVEDLITLAEFVAFPLDDLMCARVLKSPIVGMTENDLMNACLQRNDSRLWELLKHSDFFQKYHLDRLDRYVQSAHTMSAYDFFTMVLTDGVLEKFISRLGTKILDTLYEFLDIVMKYERQNTASLPSFLAWFRSFDHEIKKEPFGNDNVVRLMTVHASKGLQAPFVIIADAHFTKTAQQIDKILKDDETGLLFWNFNKSQQPKNVIQLYEQKKTADSEEADRLMYVALTRAENYLCILGKSNKNKGINPNSWFGKMQAVSENFEATTECDRNIRRFGNYEYGLRSTVMEQTKSSAELPSWFAEKIPLPQIENAHDNAETPQIIYGNYVHLLLSELANCESQLFDDYAYMLSDNFDLQKSEIQKAIAEVKHILSTHQFLFGNNSQAEVPFIFEGKEGRIDRLIETDDCTWIVDFKTGTPQNKIPQEYVNQLSTYRRAVAAIKHIDTSKIKTAILWTNSSQLIEIIE